MTDTQPAPAPDDRPTAEQVAEIRSRQHAFSGLQYATPGSPRGWPWSSVEATNRVVDLVRSIPLLLAEIDALRGEMERVKGEIRDVYSEFAPDLIRAERRAEAAEQEVALWRGVARANDTLIVDAILAERECAARAEQALAARDAEVRALREALTNVTRELQCWHDERRDPPALRPMCVTCGYLDDARAVMAAAPPDHERPAPVEKPSRPLGEYPTATEETICERCGEAGHWWCYPSRVRFKGRAQPMVYPEDAVVEGDHERPGDAVATGEGKGDV